ncbi:CLUMA_CG012205, isoform A [Clunio marinus]|uniref:CLUMA_CG012205, isoform A n=1 Tax=Clunio marinus TaxID=568069 RepID=A0A1J1IHT5_9DIPT|nr:CLUMA_CG012205, isoform A [Clunio marinus]
MSNSLKITFNNNPNAIYYPNQTVSGSVELRAIKAIKNVRGLKLIVEGSAEAKWTVSSGTGNNRSLITYFGEEKYLQSITYLFGSSDGEIQEVAAGIHIYNFVCQLPLTIPYSVDGEHGHVKYNVDANLDIAWTFDLHDKKPFTVVRYEDLSIYSELRLPIEYEEVTTFCCFWCESDPLIVKVRLPKSGYGLSEKILANVEINNKSTTKVLHTEFSLKRIARFISKTPSVETKEVKETVAEVQGKGAERGEMVTFEQIVEVPPVLMISNNRYCKVFQITYELKVTFVTDGMKVSPEVHIPITIGTVGITSNEFQSSAQMTTKPNILPASFNDAIKKF